MQILKQGKSYNFVNHVQIDSKLESLNYEYAMGQFGPMLIEVDPIKLPSKIYSNDKDFILHVKNSWEKGDGNLGICLVGEKGLGKSLTCNILAKETNAPIVRITDSLYGNDAFGFLNQIEQDFVLVIDEFEKLFNNPSASDQGIQAACNKRSATQRSKRLLLNIFQWYRLSRFLAGHAYLN